MPFQLQISFSALASCDAEVSSNDPTFTIINLVAPRLNQ
jgi:hypothetical protein